MAPLFLSRVCGLDYQLSPCHKGRKYLTEKNGIGPDGPASPSGLPLGPLPYGPGKFTFCPLPHPTSSRDVLGIAAPQNPEQTALRTADRKSFLTPTQCPLAEVLISCCTNDIFLRRLTMDIFISFGGNPTPIHKDMLWPYDPNNTIAR